MKLIKYEIVMIQNGQRSMRGVSGYNATEHCALRKLGRGRWVVDHLFTGGLLSSASSRSVAKLQAEQFERHLPNIGSIKPMKVVEGCPRLFFSYLRDLNLNIHKMTFEEWKKGV